ncbi:MAG: hypothetical protein GF384_07655 [Elusimicrobia bacterium]|nr:hypothetical protein [Elusimicrobiota bacterium]MBD3412523.1 hypothetical protein [Elusimicrobiota bacterium]
MPACEPHKQRNIFFALLPLIISFFSHGSKSTQGLLVLTVALCVFYVYFNTAFNELHVPFPFLTVCAAVLITFSVFNAYSFIRTIEPCVQYSLYYIYFLLLYNLYQEPRDYEPWYAFLLFGGIITTAVIMFQCMTQRPPCGLLPENPLYSATLLALGAVYAAEHLLNEHGLKQYGYGFCALILLYGLILTQSRGAFIGFYAGIIYLLVYHKKNKVILIIFLLSLAGVILMPVSVFEKLIFHAGSYGWGRLAIWKTALSIIASSPFLGIGPGNFEIGYRLFRFPYDDGIALYANTTHRAHNDFLQVAAESGLPFMLIVLVIILVLLKHTNIKGCFVQYSARAESLVIVLLVCALFNFPFYLPLLCLIAAGVTAHIMRHKSLPYRIVPKKYCVFPLLASLAISIVVLSVEMLPFFFNGSFAACLSPSRLKDQTVLQASSITYTNHSSAAANLLALKKSMVRCDPYDSAYFSTLGDVFARLYMNTNVHHYRRNGLACYLHAYHGDPVNVFNHAKIADICSVNQDTRAASEWYIKALSFEPRFMHALIRYGAYLTRQGDFNNAYHTFGTVLTMMNREIKKTNSYHRELFNYNKAEFFASYAGLFFADSDYRNAVWYMSKALRMDPDNPMYQQNYKLAKKNVANKQ